MTFDQAQEKVDSWIRSTGVRYFSELTNMAILSEEVGELARIMARKYGEQSFKDNEKSLDQGEEIADILFVLICIANQAGINISEEFSRAFEKRNKRDSSRHKENTKLNNSNDE